MILDPKRVEVSDHSLESVSLEGVKEHLRLLDDDEDNLLLSYVQSATGFLEPWTGYHMMPATLLAFFNSCNSCRPLYRLLGRPFNAVSKIEVLQDDVYVEITSSQYSIDQQTWETIICINNDVEIDCSVENGCQTNTEPVKITYTTGNRRTVAVSEIETVTLGTPNIAKVTLAAAHGLSNFDQVILSDTGAIAYDGTFTATIAGANIFTIRYLGADPGTKNAGTCTIPEIPPSLELAIKQMVASMYQNRGDCSDKCGQIPCSAQNLAKQFRKYIVRGAGPTHVCCCG